LDKALWRKPQVLTKSRDILDGLWRETAAHRLGDGLDLVAARETAALIANARWCITAAFMRKESRGMHMREDAPEPLPELARRLLVGGLDKLRTRYETEASWETLT
jgi:succinate dehydrogenase/fumarate reductase flavoprotein subunit